jgi:UDP-N-acetylglucosamine--N-acetylmuramyl-(pentapeptide) pyrophosphoryl-undecaprenol N-acetylglucosamine transferase
MRAIISGGGTGGHIFPAIAIADKIMERWPDASIKFIGAQGRMEMHRVPAAGYDIEGLWISGLQRRLTLDNLSWPFKVVSSLVKARSIIAKFKPDVVIGVGGYASGPALKAAALAGVPTLIQEQNSYPGITNKLLAKSADRICVAYAGMDRWFAADKTVQTGNPVRSDMIDIRIDRAAAVATFGLDPSKATVLVTGGSLGARTLNQSLAGAVDQIAARADVNIIWQAGKYYIDEYSKSATAGLDHVTVLPFIKDMRAAYAAADLVVCRAGALTISELAIVGKPSILVPSPNVAEDHQTKNAMALVDAGAAMIVRDDVAVQQMVSEMYRLIDDEEQRRRIVDKIGAFARPQATTDIVDEVAQIAKSTFTNNGLTAQIS